MLDIEATDRDSWQPMGDHLGDRCTSLTRVTSARKKADLLKNRKRQLSLSKLKIEGREAR